MNFRRLSILFLGLTSILFFGWTTPQNKIVNANVAWGFYAHKRINRMAVFTLPPPLFNFYKKHIEYITEHAVDPDKRRYAVDYEAPRHYIDIDHYVEKGEDPFEVVPENWFDAIDKFTEDTLNAYGIVPWHVNFTVYQLTEAFKEKNFDRILSLSADLGHYVGDAHVPLHTTENYNGQLTNQKGIHGFWESRIPELQAESYDYFIGKARYIKDVQTHIWKAVQASHYAVDSVLIFEKELTEDFPKDQKYSYETRGASTVKTYSEPFSSAYAKRLDGMIERRMRAAILTVGNFWYTAWVDAGQPDLKSFDKEVSDSLQKENEVLDQQYKGGKIKGREHDN